MPRCPAYLIFSIQYGFSKVNSYLTPIADATPRSVVASIFLLITGIKKASIYAGFQTLR